MTVQAMHNDIIDWRCGRITRDELRARYRDWNVPRDYAAFCVAEAERAGPPRHTRDRA